MQNINLHLHLPQNIQWSHNAGRIMATLISMEVLNTLHHQYTPSPGFKLIFQLNAHQFCICNTHTSVSSDDSLSLKCAYILKHTQLKCHLLLEACSDFLQNDLVSLFSGLWSHSDCDSGTMLLKFYMHRNRGHQIKMQILILDPGMGLRFYVSNKRPCDVMLLVCSMCHILP